MNYTLNYNRPPHHTGDEIELDEATAKRLLRMGFINEVDAPDEDDTSEQEDNADDVNDESDETKEV